LSQLGWLSWKERLVAERLERKSKRVLQLLDDTKQHWEEVFWRILASNFGIKVNTEAFEAMARSVSVNVLAKHKNQIHQLEALLLGQTNLLNGQYEEDYPKLLQKEYSFLKKKYQLQSHNILPHFLRMRPANFPTVRLAQLAMLVSQSYHLFSKLKEMQSVKEVKALLNVTANDYWHYHYTFDETAAFKPKHLGNQMIDNLVINTIVPVLFAYGLYTKQEEFKEKAIQWLQQISAEQNAITSLWHDAEIANRSAFDSQSLIELTTNYCNHQRCLDCAVGNKILQTR
jgi:Fe2+ transport system protein B